MVPASLCRCVLQAVHDVSHPGVRETQKLLKVVFCCPSMASQAAEYVRSCVPCQKCKTTFHLYSEPSRFPVNPRRFSTIHLDIIGPFSLQDRQRYVLTMVDHSSRWIKSVLLEDLNTDTVASSFLSTWVCRFGIPSQIVTDRGSQFTSAVFTSLCKFLGSRFTPTCSYHPQSNGMIEWWLRTLKQAMRIHAEKHS